MRAKPNGRRRWPELAALALIAAAGCRRASPTPAAPVTPSPTPTAVRHFDRSDAGVLVLAAGDISLPDVDRQKATSDVVLGTDFDAVLLLGDNQYPDGSLELYRRFFEPTWGRFKDRLWPSLGNHEYLTPDAAGYFAYFGARAGDPKKGYYSFDLGGWHLVALNTNLACKSVACDAGSEQVKWLEADLAASPKKCTLAFWHHPRFSSGTHGGFEGARALWDTLYAHGADVVLNGHDHIYERFEPLSPDGKLDAAKGLQQFTLGTGGAGFYPIAGLQPGSAAHDGNTHGVLALTLEPDSYRWEFLAAPPGRFADRGSARCH